MASPGRAGHLTSCSRGPGKTRHFNTVKWYFLRPSPGVSPKSRTNIVFSFTVMSIIRTWFILFPVKIRITTRLNKDLLRSAMEIVCWKWNTSLFVRLTPLSQFWWRHLCPSLLTDALCEVKEAFPADTLRQLSKLSRIFINLFYCSEW